MALILLLQPTGFKQCGDQHLGLVGLTWRCSPVCTGPAAERSETLSPLDGRPVFSRPPAGPLRVGLGQAGASTRRLASAPAQPRSADYHKRSARTSQPPPRPTRPQFRIRRRSTPTRRPPSVTSPASCPWRTAAQSGSCLPFAPTTSSTSSSINSTRRPAGPPPTKRATPPWLLPPARPTIAAPAPARRSPARSRPPQRVPYRYRRFLL